MSIVNPLPKAQRHPADNRDDIEHEDVARVLSELPEEHPARQAYLNAEPQAASSIGLSRMLAERSDLVERLAKAYSDHLARIAQRRKERLKAKHSPGQGSLF